MKQWGGQEILPLGISFSAGTPRHGVSGLTQQRGSGKAQEELGQVGRRGSTLEAASADEVQPCFQAPWQAAKPT